MRTRICGGHVVRVLATAVIGWLCVGCGAHAGGAVRGAETAVVASPLVGSLEVAVAGDSALLTLHATNPGPEAVRLEFASAQRYDFEVWTLSGERLWRWSEGRASLLFTARRLLRNLERRAKEEGKLTIRWQ